MKRTLVWHSIGLVQAGGKERERKKEKCKVKSTKKFRKKFISEHAVGQMCVGRQLMVHMCIRTVNHINYKRHVMRDDGILHIRCELT